MSLNAIAAAVSTARPVANSHPHGHRTGAQVNASSTTGDLLDAAVGSAGALPVGAAAGLLSNLLQSLQQALGIGAASTPSSQTNSAHLADTLGTKLNTRI
jgi:hypothetical protein